MPRSYYPFPTVNAPWVSSDVCQRNNWCRCGNIHRRSGSLWGDKYEIFLPTSSVPWGYPSLLHGLHWWRIGLGWFIKKWGKTYHFKQRIACMVVQRSAKWNALKTLITIQKSYLCSVRHYPLQSVRFWCAIDIPWIVPQFAFGNSSSWCVKVFFHCAVPK